jgi:hypothetical protein
MAIKEGRELVKEAIADAKSLKEAAVESAKKEIIEDLAPAVRKLLEQRLSERSRTQGYDNTRDQKQDYDGSKIKATDETVEPVAEDLTLEDALQEYFPAEAVKEKKEMDKKSSKKSSKKEGLEMEAASKKSSKKSSISEDVEISEAELRKVYEAALQTEVSVKKGFSDIVGGGELDQSHKEMGIQDNPKTKHFEEADVPHKQKWVPEAKELHSMLQRGLAENKALRENLRKAATMIETLGKKLHEVNLFNAKVLHVNKILNGGARLTKEQKTFVMESIDKARSISEVKMVFETIVGSIKTAAAVNESRRPLPNAQRPRTTGTPKQEVLSESVDRGEKTVEFSRAQELAGLIK